MVNILLVEYKDEYEDQVVPLIVLSYMFNNPFIKPLDLTREQLEQEFRDNFRKRIYQDTLIFVDGDRYSKGIFSLVGVACWGGCETFLPPKEQDGSEKNFDLVPTKSLVRLYMRHKCIQKFTEAQKNLEQQSVKWAYGTTFALAPRYLGVPGLAGTLIAKTCEAIYNKGYNGYVCHAINERAKAVVKKGLDNIEKLEIEVEVKNMLVQDTQTYPFQGKNLSQTLFLVSVNEDVLKQGMAQYLKVQPKL